MSNSRETRKLCVESPSALKRNLAEGEVAPQGNVAFNWPAGPIGNGKVVVADDGTIVVSSSAYFDDILAAVAALIDSNGRIDSWIKVLIRFAVQAGDRRAIRAHGFSRSEGERNVEWQYMGDAEFEALIAQMREDRAAGAVPPAK